MIARNTPIPVKQSEMFTTAADMQTSVTIHVFQGERPMAADNTSLGEFTLTGLPPAPRGIPKIEVTFDIDANGILDVTAKDMATNRSQSIRITGDRNKAPDAEEKFKEIAEAYAVLSNPQKRAAYDTGGLTGVGGVTPEDLFSGIDFSDLFGGLDLGFGGESIFERFFRPRRPQGPRQGAHLETVIAVPLERVLTGGEETVHLPRPITGTRAVASRWRRDGFRHCRRLSLQKIDILLLAHVLEDGRPHTHTDLTEVGLLEQQHLCAGLPNAATNAQWQRVADDGLMIGQRAPIELVGHGELLGERVGIDADAT